MYQFAFYMWSCGCSCALLMQAHAHMFTTVLQNQSNILNLILSKLLKKSSFQAQFLFMNVKLLSSEISNTGCVYTRKCQSHIITKTLISTLKTFARLFFYFGEKLSSQARNRCLLFLASALYGLFINQIHKSSIHCVCLIFLSAYFSMYYAEQDSEIAPLISTARIGT